MKPGILIAQNDSLMDMHRRLLDNTRKVIWAVIVAFMVGMYNFYKGEYHSEEDIRPRAKGRDVENSA